MKLIITTTAGTPVRPSGFVTGHDQQGNEVTESFPLPWPISERKVRRALRLGAGRRTKRLKLESCFSTEFHMCSGLFANISSVNFCP